MHTLVHEQDIRDEGITIGLERGIERGIEQGLEEGVKQGLLATTQRLLQKNYSDEEIMDIVDCTQELINEARNMLN